MKSKVTLRAIKALKDKNPAFLSSHFVTQLKKINHFYF
jgi:hypothetical protein